MPGRGLERVIVMQKAAETESWQKERADDPPPPPVSDLAPLKWPL